MSPHDPSCSCLLSSEMPSSGSPRVRPFARSGTRAQARLAGRFSRMRTVRPCCYCMRPLDQPPPPPGDPLHNYQIRRGGPARPALFVATCELEAVPDELEGIVPVPIRQTRLYSTPAAGLAPPVSVRFPQRTRARCGFCLRRPFKRCSNLEGGHSYACHGRRRRGGKTHTPHTPLLRVRR